MTRSAIFLALLGLLAGCDDPPAAPSLRLALFNGGFEEGQATPAAWWNGATSASGFTFSWPGGSAYDGKRAVRIKRIEGTTTGFAFWAQTFLAEDFIGGPVTLRVRIRTELVGEGVAIAIRGDDTETTSGNGEIFATTQRTTPITGSRNWEEFSVTFDDVPASMVSLTVYLLFGPGTTGTADFDLVEFGRP